MINLLLQISEDSVHCTESFLRAESGRGGDPISFWNVQSHEY